MAETEMLKAGIKGRKEEVVTSENSAMAIGSGLLDVYATPSMIALMEGCCHESVEQYLDPGSGTVGISVSIKHVAATPPGIKVYCESELVKIEKRFLTFNVKAFDEKGLIGEGVHERCIIDNERFLKKVSEKYGKDTD